MLHSSDLIGMAVLGTIMIGGLLVFYKLAKGGLLSTLQRWGASPVPSRRILWLFSSLLLCGIPLLLPLPGFQPTLPMLAAFAVLFGIGGMASQALHLLWWFAPPDVSTHHPDKDRRSRIERMYPQARPAILLMVAFQAVPWLACFGAGVYIFVRFVRL